MSSLYPQYHADLYINSLYKYFMSPYYVVSNVVDGGVTNNEEFKASKSM